MRELPGFKTRESAGKEALKYIQGRRTGEIRSIITPWKSFNDVHIDGIEMRRVVTIGGMSGSGKTAISAQLEREIFELNPTEDFAVLSFNFEMPSMDLVLRGIQSEFTLSNREILSAEGLSLGDREYEMIKAYVETDDAKLEIYYVEFPQTADQYFALVQKFQDFIKKKFIVISDHSILFKRGADEHSVNEMLYSLSDKAISLKKMCECTQFFLSQMNREIEKVERRIPKNAMNYPSKDCLFGADALFMCSDTVLVSHRPYLLNFPINTYGPEKLECGPNDVYWHYLKQRHGEPRISRMLGDFANMRILDKS